MKKIRNLIRMSWRILNWNWPVFLLFEIIYKLFLLVLLPFIQRVIDYALGRAGIVYLTQQNVVCIFKNPFSMVILILTAILFLYVSFIETAAIVWYCGMGAQGEKVSVRVLFAKSIKTAGSIWKPKNLWMIILLFLSLPLTGLTVMSGPLSSLKIPGFIRDFIQENQSLSILCGIVVLALAYMLFQWLFGIHDFILNRCSYKEACQRSRNFLKGRKIKTVVMVICGITFLWAAVLLVWLAVTAGLMLWIRLTAKPQDALYSFWYHYHDLRNIARLLASILKPVFLFTVITAVYYEARSVDSSVQTKKKNAVQWLSLFAQCAAWTAAAALYVEMTVPYRYGFLEDREIQVIAHRAGAKFAPENTLAALNKAIKSGADAAEIDVQQTKDGALIVMHDTSFKRTAGVKKKVWDVTLKEAKALDVGSFFSAYYQNERVPTLEEMIQAANGRIRLMIELKSSGHEKGLEEKTVELIHRYRFEGQCSVASMDYRILQKIKKLDAAIQTVYISSIAYGDAAELKDADVISVEETFVNSRMKALAETYGKKVYAWTINDKNSIKKIGRLKVDGIVTDNVYFTEYILETEDRGSLLFHLLTSM